MMLLALRPASHFTVKRLYILEGPTRLVIPKLSSLRRLALATIDPNRLVALYQDYEDLERLNIFSTLVILRSIRHSVMISIHVSNSGSIYNTGNSARAYSH